MKKIFSYILIALIVVQIFAPFSIRGGLKNNLTIDSNKAEAMWFINSDIGIKLQTLAESKDTAIKIIIEVDWEKTSLLSADDKMVVVKKHDGTENGQMIIVPLEERDPDDSSKEKGFVEFTGLTQDTDYMFDVVATQQTRGLLQAAFNIATAMGRLLTADEIPIIGKIFEYNENKGVVKNIEPYVIRTLPAGSQNYTPQEIENTVLRNDADLLPECDIASSKTWGGCIGRVLYIAIFRPTSVLFALSGKLLDVSVDYSTRDTSYRSPFVVQGWGVIRDFCNMFFIFILLYIAFGTILKLHSVKTKEMIVNVVIIGLFINFSLFAVQVIIDASNMLTRVFYNPETIVIGKKYDGIIKTELGSQGEIKLSEAIVGKINPQKLILNAGEAGEIRTKQTISEDNETKNTNKYNVSSSTFILVTILASIVNIVGIIVFISVSLIFISRVIGLWLAMIFAPLAFFSYTIPSLQDMEFVGWKKWWPETIKMAFLAPVFVFFLYLIVMFLETGLGLKMNDSKGTMDFILGIFIPFIFIMILLMKAKDIAKDMSGKIGQTITNGLAAVGGIALGGAALGAAALGRSTIGSVAKYTGNDSKREKDSNMRSSFKDQWNKGGLSSVNPLGYLNVVGKGINANIAKTAVSFGQQKDANGNITKKGWVQQQTQDLKDKDHSEHVLNDAAKKVTGKDTVYKDLDEPEKKKVKNYVDRDIVAKSQYNGLSWDQLKADQRHDLEFTHMDREGNWSSSAEHLVDHNKGEHSASEMEKSLTKGSVATGEFINALKKGSYDIRNISKLQTSSKGMAKMGVGLAALVAVGVRSGLKGGVGIDHGTGQKDVWKDIGNVISDSLKGVKIDMPKAPPAAHGGGHDDHGGGHGGGHH